MGRPLIKLGIEGPDVLEAKLRLNLAGASPQLRPTETFDDATKTAAEEFQAAHGLEVDGEIGDNTWSLLDQLARDRLLTAADLSGIDATREAARLLLKGGDYATAKSLLDVEYAKPGLPPESRSGVAAGLSWAEQGLGNFDRARDLLVEASIIASMFPAELVLRDFVHRLREINLRQMPGLLPSQQNAELLPPSE